MSVPDPSRAVLCAGRLYCDLVFTGVPNLPVMGVETFAPGLSLHAGGGAFITSAAFRALGWSASLVSTLPAAPFDTLVRADIAALGVDADCCVAAEPGAGPQITVAIAAGDDRAFLSHKSGAAIPEIVFSRDRWRHLHIGELRTLEEHPDLIAKARAAGMTISLDCGWDDALLAQGAAMSDLIGAVDVFLPNESEFDRLVASGWTGDGKPLTVVKCGAQGARARSRDGWVANATTQVEVVDATGAGDAFNGGFLAGWMAGEALEDCLRAGNLCGAAAVQAAGGTGGLDRLGAELSAARAGAAQ